MKLNLKVVKFILYHSIIVAGVHQGQGLCNIEEFSDPKFMPLKREKKQILNQPSLSSQQKREQFYQTRLGKPIWLYREGLTEAGKHALWTLQNADQEGLDPLAYQPIFKIISELNFKDLSIEDLRRYDALMTQYIVLYLEALEGERLHPEKVNREIHLKVKNIDSYRILEEKMTEDISGKWLLTYTLRHQEYQRLKNLLMAYRNIERHGGWPQFNLPASIKFEIGTSYPWVTHLKKQLSIQGDLKAQDLNDPIFTAELMVALKQFQRRHGLEDDGKIGLETHQALNVPVEDRIRQILISMERWRWAPDQKSNQLSILVNIAGYYLQAFNGGQKVLEMPVIIGQNLRQTPVFISQIDFIRFNPTWHVPHSIAVKDKLPLLQSQPWYFKTKGYTIYDYDGFPVDAEDVDWTKIKATSFHYKIVQSSGDANALGKLFFHMNTPFDVFLHGTPNVELFKKAKRSLSSGCIRLQDPKALAQFILQNDSKWTDEKISEYLDQKKTYDVILHSPVEAYITYQTVWVDDENLAHFVDDIYGQDKTIDIALKNQNLAKPVFE